MLVSGVQYIELYTHTHTQRIHLQCRRPEFISVPGLGRSPGVGSGTPLQYSCLENPMDREAWQATVHWLAESDMTKAT